MFGQTPEVLENEIGECLETRALSLPGFRGLGPADLVQLTKATKSKTSSTHHCVTGVDVSSAAAIAAYLTTLNSALGETQLWFGRAQQWKVVEGTYCCWNTFSKVDVRVSANFPGTTRMYMLTIDGLPEDRGSDDDELWRELYMSAMIRCLLLKDEDAFFMENTRHEYPFDPAAVRHFFDCFEALYYKAPLIGANSTVQNPTLDCNFMVDALYVLLDVTGEYQAAIDMLGRLDAKEVLAQVLLLANQEVNAISLLVNTVRKDPRNARMLVMETEFCLAKKQYDLALDCARRAVSAAPADFYSWEALCKVYIAMEQWDQALLTLNAAPLIPYLPMDVQRFPPPKKVHAPLPTDGVLDEVWEFSYNKNNPAAANAMSADPALSRLPGATLRGCAAKAYALLASINAKIGWSKLMAYRGDVFWMESESEASEEAPNSSDSNGNGNGSDSGEGGNGDSGKGGGGNDADTNSSATPSDSASPSGQEARTDNGVTEKTSNGERRRRTLRSKRLCERRIDRLFLVLFEDVRAYSAWQREAVHLESQKLPFEKSSTEWQMFGCLAQRLHHHEQAKHALEKSLSMYFNHRSLVRQLEYHPLSLDICVKLMAWDHRWYNEFSPRTSKILREIVARDGLTKVTYEVEAEFGKHSVVDLVKVSLERLRTLKVKGFDM